MFFALLRSVLLCVLSVARFIKHMGQQDLGQVVIESRSLESLQRDSAFAEAPTPILIVSRDLSGYVSKKTEGKTGHSNFVSVITFNHLDPRSILCRMNGTKVRCES